MPVGILPASQDLAAKVNFAFGAEVQGFFGMDAVTDAVFIDDITFQGVDGYSLAATLFMPRGPRRQAILINSATAVPRKIYAGFATYLAGRGNVVVTYDYRGIGGSKPATLKGFETSMSDWAARDVTAAVTYMRARWPTMRLNNVGHSFGAQALGLLPNNNHISRALLVAGQAAYWGLMSGNERYRVYVLMNYIGKPITQIMGYAPGKLGIGEDLPKGVFLEWTKWVNNKRYLFDDPTLKTLANFSHYRGALRALSFTDDEWAPLAAVELLCSGFTATKPDVVSISPKHVGADEIGHLGFFRPENRDRLWKDSADWLLAN
jgi:predicted alpha/beta hydrolase